MALLIASLLIPGQVSRGEPSKKIHGRWRPARKATGQGRLPAKADVSRLASLPYLQGYRRATHRRGITIYKRDKALEGLNFYSSGHANVAVLMDMEGNTLHEWTLKSIREVWPLTNLGEAATHWRRAHLYPNGDILAIYEGIGMLKLDKDSRVLWAFNTRLPHHHMQVSETGDIFVLTKRREEIPWLKISDEKPVTDYITVLKPGADIAAEYSILTGFRNSGYNEILSKLSNKEDLLHTNTIQLLDGSLGHLSPLFKKGNVLLASLFLNAIYILDSSENKVVWMMDGDENGLWVGMHEPSLLESGNILLFANNWVSSGMGNSEILEIDPFTKKTVWSYRGSEEEPFYSRLCGTCQRLPNGNTLIAESENGRAFEVTKEGDTVWEFVSPHRAGENNELIATLLHIRRIPRDYAAWLGNKTQRFNEAKVKPGGDE